MKRLLRWSVLGLTLMAMILLLAGPVAAKATRTQLTACEYDVSYDEGEWTNPGGRRHLRGRVHYFYDVATDPRATGVVTVIAHANWSYDWIGTAWGTFKLEPYDEARGGYWEGTWVGPDNQPEIRLVGHGRGNFKGLELRETLVWDEDSLGKCSPEDLQGNPISGYIEGYILDAGQ